MSGRICLQYVVPIKNSLIYLFICDAHLEASKLQIRQAGVSNVLMGGYSSYEWSTLNARQVSVNQVITPSIP